VNAGDNDVFRVEGAVERPASWTAERLTKDFASEIRTITYTSKGEKETARCVPLLAVIKAAGLKENPKAKNAALAFAVVVRASDGYATCFSMGELTADVGNRDVYVALDRNGYPLPGDDGPVQLIVPADGKPSRWVHGVTRIVLIDGLAATEPAGSKE
jgi:hypothetical protein